MWRRPVVTSHQPTELTSFKHEASLHGRTIVCAFPGETAENVCVSVSDWALINPSQV